jgi:hypothetical protein
MHGIIHPFSKALYEQDGAGHIKVSLDGKWGLFNIDGSYIEGEIRGCDPPQVANHRVAAPALERK